MKIELIDYVGKRVTHEIPEKSEILCATINIKSGDETLNIITKKGDMLFFDASDCRIHGSDDGAYLLYAEGIVDLIDNPKWKSRTSSYDWP